MPSVIYEYKRMTGTELQTALDDIGISVIDFVRLTGHAEKTVRQWLNDEKDIPHHILVLCGYFWLHDTVYAQKLFDKLAVRRRGNEPIPNGT